MGPDPQSIKQMFSKVAQSYDKANTVLSFGIHHLWKYKLIRMAQVKPGSRVLDCATGTGDLAILFKKKYGDLIQVTGIDFCEDMLKCAPQKAAGLDIQFELGDVTQLRFSDQSFDVVTIAFGIRNVSDPLRGLSEMRRVLAPGGHLLVLEFGQPTLPIFSHFYKVYSQNILPKVGGWLSGDSSAYSYLQESSAQFPSGESFVQLMKKAGFQNVNVTPLTGGVAYIYKGSV